MRAESRVLPMPEIEIEISVMLRSLDLAHDTVGKVPSVRVRGLRLHLLQDFRRM